MTVTEIAAKVAVDSLVTHLKRWVANALRAKKPRKEESRRAVEKVILAVRKTAVYCRALDEGMAEDYARESEISVEWTELSFELDNLGLKALAKKCRVKGWYWEDQGRFDSAFLAKAQVSFAEVESAARRLLKEINAG